jgi:hypothetical protein
MKRPCLLAGLAGRCGRGAGRRRRPAARVRARREERQAPASPRPSPRSTAPQEDQQRQLRVRAAQPLPLRLCQALRAADRGRRPEGLDLRRRPEPGQLAQAGPGAGQHAGGAAGRRQPRAGLRAVAAQPSAGGLDWVLATPEGDRRLVQEHARRLQGPDLAAVEIVDNFGQRSLLQFSGFAANAAVAPEQFRFVPCRPAPTWSSSSAGTVGGVCRTGAPRTQSAHESADQDSLLTPPSPAAQSLRPCGPPADGRAAGRAPAPAHAGRGDRPAAPAGPGRPLRAALETGRVHSMILWGPPGVGKTTLARLLAQAVDAQFIVLSAVLAA